VNKQGTNKKHKKYNVLLSVLIKSTQLWVMLFNTVRKVPIAFGSSDEF
jgi:hypothetical protein